MLGQRLDDGRRCSVGVVFILHPDLDKPVKALSSYHGGVLDRAVVLPYVDGGRSSRSWGWRGEGLRLGVDQRWHQSQSAREDSRGEHCGKLSFDVVLAGAIRMRREKCGGLNR